MSNVVVSTVCIRLRVNVVVSESHGKLLGLQSINCSDENTAGVSNLDPPRRANQLCLLHTVWAHSLLVRMHTEYKNTDHDSKIAY